MNRWLATGILCAVVTLHNAQRLAPVPLLTEFCQRLNVDYVGAGNLFGAFLFGTAVANIPVGILADRYGSKGLIAAGAALGLILSVIFALTHNYWIALATRFGLGAAGSLLFVPTLRYIVSSFPKELRGSAMGFMQVGSGMGMVFSLTILPVLSARFDLSKTFLVLPALAILILGLVLFGLRSARPASKPLVWKQIGSLARCGPFWHLSAFHFLTMLTVYAVLGWLPTFLRLDFGYSATHAGVISALVNVAFALFSPLTGYASDRLGSRTPIMVMGSLLSVGCFAIFIVSGEPVMILAAVVLTGLSMALTIPLSQVLVGETFSGIGSGLAVSATNTAGRIAASLPGMVGGFILQVSGTFAAVWGLALLFGGARIPFLIAVREGRASTHREVIEEPISDDTFVRKNP
jgi:MFS family permease